MPNNKLLQTLAASAKRVNPEEIMAKVAFTQAVLESGAMGKVSQLATKYHNWFGIKKAGTHKPGLINLKTKEELDGNKNTLEDTRDYFGWNNTDDDSFQQHRNLMMIKRYKPVRDADTLNEAFIQLYKAGYATDPKYSIKLQSLYDTTLKYYI